MAQSSNALNIENSQPPGDVAGGTAHGPLRTILLRVPLHWIIGVLLCIAALAFNLYHLGRPSIWFDEAFSVELARQPLPLLWHIIFGPEPNMELYYLFLHFWLAITGALGLHPTEVVVRLPSVICAALSTVFVFVLGRRYLGLIGATMAATLYLLNDLQLIYAQQTRSYALQLLLICIAWYALCAALTEKVRTRRWWIVYVVAMALAVYAHLFSMLILLAQVVAFAGLLLLPNAWRVGARKQIIAFGSSLVAIGVLIIPMLLESRQGAKTGWLTVPHFNDLTYLFVMISGDSKRYLYAITACAVLGVLVLFVAYVLYLVPALRRPLPLKSSVDAALADYQRYLPFAWSLLCWFVIPLVVSYVVSHGSLRLFSTRYLVVIVPPLCLLIALGVVVLRWRILQALLALILLVLAVMAVPQYYRSAQVEDWNSTSHWMLQRYQAGDGLVCYDNEITQGCQIAVEYYLHAYPNGAHFTPDTPGAFSWQNYGPADPRAGYNAALDPAALAAFATQHPRFFFIVGRVPTDAAAARVQSIQHWLDAHYHFVDQVVMRTVTIRLYETAPHKG